VKNVQSNIVRPLEILSGSMHKIACIKNVGHLSKIYSMARSIGILMKRDITANKIKE